MAQRPIGVRWSGGGNSTNYSNNRRLLQEQPFCYKKEKDRLGRSYFFAKVRFGLVLEGRLVRYRQLLATLCAASCKYLAAVSRSHTSAETVLVDALATRGLISSLHCHSCIVFVVLDFFTECKSTTKNLSAKIFCENISKTAQKAPKDVIFVE